MLKLKFITAELEDKIRIYTETPDLTARQYRELLEHYPYKKLYRLEEALA